MDSTSGGLVSTLKVVETVTLSNSPALSHVTDTVCAPGFSPVIVVVNSLPSSERVRVPDFN